MVSQDHYLFQLCILENLKLVNKTITKKDIIKACQKAHIHEDIIALPNGYETIIEENGANFSGGQKQRLAIARALLKKAPILLLDEATSALDNDTQEKIQASIHQLHGTCTILLIAHRLSSIKNSDHIFFIDQGKIIASGSHKHLLKTNSLYRKFYSLENKKSN